MAYSKESVIAEKFEAIKNPIVFEKSFANDKEKTIQWRAFKRRVSVGDALEFSEVVGMIDIFLKPIYECIFAKKEFTGHWKKDAVKWSV